MFLSGANHSSTLGYSMSTQVWTTIISYGF